MKNTGKNVNILNLMAFIGIIIIAVLEIFAFFASHDILTVGGGLINFLNTLKNVCILVVIGITAYNFVKGKSKGWVITYIVAISVIVLTTIFIWIKF
nr:hypothetical protein [Clostridia bacterium]